MIKEQNQNLQRAIFAESVISSYTIILKELIDNSLDANSSKIYIECTFDKTKDFSCQVADNGTGISHRDLSTLCFRGTTSKLTTAEDVNKVDTAGFRGEALSAIAYMSDLTVFSKVAGCSLFKALYSRQGELSLCESAPFPHKVFLSHDSGTMMRATQVFSSSLIKNMVHKESLAERRKEVKDMVEDYILINPTVDFDFVITDTQQKREVVYSEENMAKRRDFKQRLELVFGRNRVDGLVEMERSNGFYRIIVNFTGTLDSGSKFNKKSEIVKYFVNGKAVSRIKNIDKVVKSVYQRYSRTGFCDRVVRIEAVKGEFDFNMNSKKNEVALFREKEMVVEIQSMAEKTLESNLIVKRMEGTSLRVIGKEQLHEGNNFTFTKIELQREDLKYSDRKEQRREEVKKEQLSESDSEESKADEIAVFENKQEIVVFENKQEKTVSDNKKEFISKIGRRDIIYEPRQENIYYKAPITINLPSKSKVPERRPSSQSVSSAECIDDEKEIVPYGYEIKEETVDLSTLNNDAFKEMRVLGQFNKGFVLVEYKSNYFLLDQHACDERINYEKLSSVTELPKQILIKPMKIGNISNESIALIKLNDTLFRNIQFEIDYFDHHLELKTVPSISKYNYESDDFIDLVGKLEMDKDFMEKNKDWPMKILWNKNINKHVAMQACRMSVMVGKSLSMREMDVLVKQVGLCEDPWHCAHGRPTIVALNNN